MKSAGVIAVVLLATLSSPRAQERARGQTRAIVGIWKLSPDKSRIRVPPGWVEIRQYVERPDGFLVGLLITGDGRGYHYLQFVARSDGKDYPEYSDQIVGDLIAAGTPTRRTYAETIDSDHVTDWTDKVDGRVTAHGKKTVSSDGQTLTITVDGSSTVRVYDRQ